MFSTSGNMFDKKHPLITKRVNSQNPGTDQMIIIIIKTNDYEA